MRNKDVCMVIWNLVCILPAICFASQLDPYLEEKLQKFDQELQEASTEVVELFSPHYEMPELPGDFHHSYISGTGFLNREETFVDGLIAVNEFELYGNIPAADWEVFEYGSKEFIIAASHKGLTFIEVVDDETTVVNKDVPGCLSLEHFVVAFNPSELGTLYLTVLQQLANGRFINIYTLKDNYEMVLVSSTQVDENVISIHHQRLVHINKHALFAVTSSSLGKKTYTKVFTLLTRERSLYLREMNDIPCFGLCVFTPFLVHGEVMVAVASDTDDSLLYRFDDENLEFEPIQAFVSATHVEAFRIGFHHFLAWVSTDVLIIYTYNGADFTLWQEVRSPGLVNLEVLPLPTCRDEVLLVTTSEPSTGTSSPKIGLLKYWSQSHNFTYADAACVEYVEYRDTSVNSPLDTDFHFDSFEQAQVACAQNVSCKGVQTFYNTDQGQMHLVYELQSASRDEAGHRFEGLDFWEKVNLGDLYCVNQLVSSQPVQALALRYMSGLMFQSPDSGIVTVMAVAFHLQHQHDPVWLDNRDLQAHMKNIEDHIILQQESLDQISAVLSAAVSPRGNVTVKANQKLDGVVTSAVTANRLDLLGDLGFDKSRLRKDDFPMDLDGFRQKIVQLEQAVDDFNTLLDDIVYVDDAASITGSKIFNTPAMIGQLRASSLVIGEILQVDVSDLLYDIVKIDVSTEIEGVKTFNSGLDVKRNVVTDFINGLKLTEDVVTVNTEQRIEGSVSYGFEPFIRTNVEVAGLTGSISLGQEAIGVTEGPQITGVKHFQSEVFAASGAVSGYVDDVDVAALADNALTKTGHQKILGFIEFKQDLVIEKNLYVGGLLNGVNVSRLTEQAVRVDKDELITGVKKFNVDVNIASNLNVLETVNGVRIPDNFFTTDREQQITGYKHFSGYAIFIDDVAVDGLVDGLKIPTDVVTLSTDQTLPHLAFLEGIVVQDDVQCSGTIDGVDVSALATSAIPINQDTSVYLDLKFMGDVVVKGALDVRANVNGEDLELLAKDLVYKDDERVEFTSVKTFHSLSVGDLTVQGLVNELDIHRHFVDLKSPQDISGVKIFADRVTVNHDVKVKGLIDNVDVGKLYEYRVTLSTPQEIRGHLQFPEKAVVEGNLEMDDTLSGIDPSEDLVFKNRNQTIYGNKKFDDVLRSSDIRTTNVVVYNKIDNMDIKAFAKGRGRLNQEDSLAEMLELMNDVILNGDLDVEFVNGRPFRAFMDDIVRINLQQIVLGNKNIRSRINLAGPSTTAGINNILLNEVREWAFPLIGPVVIQSTPTFVDPISISRGIVEGLIDGVNIKKFADDLVRRNGNEHIPGYKVFSSGFTILGNLFSNSINGHDLSQSLLTRTSDQVIPAVYQFLTVRVEGSALTDIVNGKDLADFDKKVMRTVGNNTLRGTLLVEQLLRVGDVVVHGLLNGQDIVQLTDKAVYLDLDQDITGHKQFQKVEITGDVIVGNTVNGEVLYDWVEDVVYIDLEQQEIIGEKSLRSGTVNDATSRCNVNAETVSEVDIEALAEEAIPLTGGELLGSISFTFDHAVWTDLAMERGMMINGVDLSEDVVTLSGNQQIRGAVGLEFATSMANVQVTGTVNGQYLPSLPSDTLTQEGHAHVDGYKVFSNQVILKDDLLLDGLIKDIDFGQEVVPLSSSQLMVMKLFTSPVTVEGDVRAMGEINGVILSRLEATALYQDKRYQTVTVPYKMMGHVTFQQDVDTDGTVDSVDLSELRRPFFAELDVNELEVWEEATLGQCGLLNTMTGLLRDGLHQLDHWVNVQEFAEDSGLHSLAFSTPTHHVLFTSVPVDDQCGLVNIHRLADRGFVKTGEMKINMVLGFSSYVKDQTKFVVTASLTNCGDLDGSAVWVYDESSEALMMYASLRHPSVGASSVVVGDVPHIVLVGGLDEPTNLLAEEKPGYFSTIYQLPPGVLDALMFNVGNLTYLAMCQQDGTTELLKVRESRVVSVQRLVTPLCSSLTVLRVDGRVFLTVSRTESLSIVWDRPLAFAEVYVWTPDTAQPFVPFHATSVHDGSSPVLLTSLKADRDNFYFATMENIGVKIFQYKGASGFVAVGSIYDTAINDVYPFQAGDDYYLAMTRINANTILYKAVFVDSRFKSNDLDCGLVHDVGNKALTRQLKNTKTLLITRPISNPYLYRPAPYPVYPFPVQPMHYSQLYDTEGFLQDQPDTPETVDGSIHEVRKVSIVETSTKHPQSPYSHVSGFYAHRTPPQRRMFRKYTRKIPLHFKAVEEEKESGKILSIRPKKETKSIRFNNEVDHELECNMLLKSKLEEKELALKDANNTNPVMSNFSFNVFSVLKNLIKTLNSSSEDLNHLKIEVSEMEKEFATGINSQENMKPLHINSSGQNSIQHTIDKQTGIDSDLIKIGLPSRNNLPVDKEKTLGKSVPLKDISETLSHVAKTNHSQKSSYQKPHSSVLSNSTTVPATSSTEVSKNGSEELIFDVSQLIGYLKTIKPITENVDSPATPLPDFQDKSFQSKKEQDEDFSDHLHKFPVTFNLDKTAFMKSEIDQSDEITSDINAGFRNKQIESDAEHKFLEKISDRYSVDISKEKDSNAKIRHRMDLLNRNVKGEISDEAKKEAEWELVDPLSGDLNAESKHEMNREEPNKSEKQSEKYLHTKEHSPSNSAQSNQKQISEKVKESKHVDKFTEKEIRSHLAKMNLRAGMQAWKKINDDSIMIYPNRSRILDNTEDLELISRYEQLVEPNAEVLNQDTSKALNEELMSFSRPEISTNLEDRGQTHDDVVKVTKIKTGNSQAYRDKHYKTSPTHPHEVHEHKKFQSNTELFPEILNQEKRREDFSSNLDKYELLNAEHGASSQAGNRDQMVKLHHTQLIKLHEKNHTEPMAAEVTEQDDLLKDGGSLVYGSSEAFDDLVNVQHKKPYKLNFESVKQDGKHESKDHQIGYSRKIGSLALEEQKTEASDKMNLSENNFKKSGNLIPGEFKDNRNDFIDAKVGARNHKTVSVHEDAKRNSHEKTEWENFTNKSRSIEPIRHLASSEKIHPNFDDFARHTSKALSDDDVYNKPSLRSNKNLPIEFHKLETKDPESLVDGISEPPIKTELNYGDISEQSGLPLDKTAEEKEAKSISLSKKQNSRKEHHFKALSSNHRQIGNSDSSSSLNEKPLLENFDFPENAKAGEELILRNGNVKTSNQSEVKKIKLKSKSEMSRVDLYAFLKGILTVTESSPLKVSNVSESNQSRSEDSYISKQDQYTASGTIADETSSYKL